MKSSTIDYYNQNVDKFVKDTVDVLFTETQEKFLSKLASGAYILDFGCGSGRDTKFFLEEGYKVDAIDGSEEMCQYASKYAGINVRQMFFEDLSDENKYDGIWACSSILHLEKKKLYDVLIKMVKALRSNGIIYTSFKYGDFEGERNGRYFTDFNSESFEDFIKNINGVEIEEVWITGDVRPGRGNEKWLNVILRKK